MSHRILIAGYIGFGNAGDEAIAQTVIGHLRERLPEAELTAVSGDPPATAFAYGVRAIGWRDPMALAEAVRTTDLTILGGGGLFQDYWGFDPAAILTREHWGLSFYLAPALLSAVFGKPLMLYAVGAGPLVSEHGRTYTKVAGDIAARITVRDPAGKKLFESLGVPAAKITVTADPAFDLVPTSEAAGFPEVREWKAAAPAIAVCLRTWNFGADSTFCDREVAAALDEVLSQEGGRVLFVPLAGGDDVYCARRVHKQMRFRESAAVLERWCSPAALAGIIGSADLVLAMRLHSMIFSLTAGVPFVALGYDPKVSGLAEMTGLQEYTLDFGGIEWDVLARRLRQALREKSRFRELAGTLAGCLRERARENAAIAGELLHRGAEAFDYGPDARTLVGRMLMAQVREVEARIRASEEAQAKLAESRQEAERLQAELQDARLAADAAEQRAAEVAGEMREVEREAETAREQAVEESRRTAQLSLELEAAVARSAALADSVAGLERRLAGHESKTFGGIAKRGLQLVLDTCQMLTPGPLRSAVRKYYLNWFYFRMFPEKATGPRMEEVGSRK